MLASMLLVTHSLSLLLQVATLSRGATPNKVRLRAEPCQAILPAHFGLSGASVNQFCSSPTGYPPQQGYGGPPQGYQQQQYGQGYPGVMLLPHC